MTTRRAVRRAPVVACLALVAAGCQADGGAADFTIERGPFDGGLDQIVTEAIGDGDPRQGAQLETCPILSEGGIAEAADDAGVDLEDTESVRGFTSVVSGGLAVNCSVGGLTVSVQQTRALDADEFLQTLFTDVPEAPDYSTGDSFGDLEEGKVFTSDEAPAAGWIDNGIAITAVFPRDRDDVTSDDAGAVLEVIQADVVETVEGTASGGADFAVPTADELARTDIAEAMDSALPEAAQGSAQLQQLDGTCPVLDEDAAADLGGQLDLELTPSTGETASGVPNPTIRCVLGEPSEDGVDLTVSLERPRSVAEFTFRNDSALNDSAEREVSALTEGVDGIDAERTMLLETDGQQQAGWINNGLIIVASVPEGADPGAVISEAVPRVLDVLGLG